MTNEFKTTSWEQGEQDASAGPGVVHAHAVDEFSGVIQGEHVTDYVMTFAPDGTAWGSGGYIGYGKITGTVDGKQGSFVVRHDGTFQDTTVRGTWSVVPGYGTGELTGLRGEGGYVAAHGEPATSYTFDYSFEGWTE